MNQPSVALARVRHHVRALLTAKGVQQGQLAEFLGVSSGWMSMFLKGKRPVDWPVVDRMAEYFEIPLSALFADPNAEALHSLPSHGSLERKGSHVVASSASSRRGELPEDRIRAQQALIATQQASIAQYHQRLAEAQAERGRLQRMFELAENHLFSLIETFKEFSQEPASKGDATPRGVPPRSVHAPRAVRR